MRRNPCCQTATKIAICIDGVGNSISGFGIWTDVIVLPMQKELGLVIVMVYNCKVLLPYQSSGLEKGSG